MTIGLTYLVNGGGGAGLDLVVSSIDARQPSLPLSAYYNTYGLDQDAINSQINTWYDQNNDKLVITLGGATQALSFKYKIVEQSLDFSTSSEILTTNKTFTVSGLVPGKVYKIKVQGFQLIDGSGESGMYAIKENIYISKFERLAKITATASPIPQDTSLTITEQQIFGLINNQAPTGSQDDSIAQDTSLTIAEQQIFGLIKNEAPITKPEYFSNRSLVSLTNSSKDANTYAVAHKVVHEIPLPPSLITGTPKYYSFGTTMILDASVESTGESGGIGFFMNDFANTGYFVQVDSTKRSGDINSKRRIKLYKVSGQDKVFISDSQTIPENTIDAIYPGEPYKIDIKVKHTGNTALIDIYVNGFRISAEDENPLQPTNQLAMVSKIGTVFFDYIYGFEISETDYADEGLWNIYTKNLSTAALKFALIDKIFDKNFKVTGSWPQTGKIYDFGKIARELKKIDVSFQNAPTFPIAPSVGINNSVYVVGHKSDNFKSEVFVLNNSGFFTPLSDGNVSLVIYGYNIYKSGLLEYQDESSNIFTKDEPIYFESNWIQNEEDVKNLSAWLKDQWSKSNLIVDVKVFGGILLSVGDIVTINYPYQGLTTSQKFLVQSVNHSYSDGGIETTLTCRSI